MSTALLAQNRLHQLIERFDSCRIAVLGDFFLDKYLDTDPALVETSVETGKEAHQVVRIRCSPGAAGTVVNNLAALNPGVLHAIASPATTVKPLNCGADWLPATVQPIV